MPPLSLLAIAIGPGLFWLWFFVRRDRLEPEPRWLLVRTFVLGACALFPAALLEMHIPDPLDIVLAAPVLEEAIKLLVVYLTVFRHLEFDEPMDGITYAVACALGFATIENVFFVVQTQHDPVGVAAFRALLTVPGHALWAVLWGYGLGRMRFSRGPAAQAFLAAGLGLAMLSHSLFNLACAATDWWGWSALLLPLMATAGWVLANRRTRDALMRGDLRAGAMPLPLPGRHEPPAPLPPALPPPPPPPHDQD